MDSDYVVVDPRGHLKSYTLSNALPGSYMDFPMVAPGLPGPQWKPPSTADRQINLPSAKKELSKSQPWRVDEWREYRLFERALRRYFRTTDATLMQFVTFWVQKQSPDSPIFQAFMQSRAMTDAVTEYRMRNKAVLDFIHDLIIYHSDTVTGRDIEKFQDMGDGLGLYRHLQQISLCSR